MKKLYNITPWWLTGFTQADGSFLVSHEFRPDSRLPFYPQPVFSLTQSVRDLEMMQAIHAYLGVGQLSFSKGCVTLTVRNLQDLLTVIIPHFDAYPLRGGKYLAFLRLKIVCTLKNSKQHLQLTVYLQIVQLTCINPVLYAKIMEATVKKYGILPHFDFIDLNQWITSPIPAVSMHIDYVTGLIDGDGSINFSFPKRQRRVIPNVTVIASLEDLEVLHDLIIFFDCGKIYLLPSKAAVFKVETVNDILYKVWPKIILGVFNTVKQTYLEPSYKALLILKNQGVKHDDDLLRIVDLVYNMNQGGKNRKLTKAAYCDMFITKR